MGTRAFELPMAKLDRWRTTQKNVSVTERPSLDYLFHNKCWLDSSLLRPLLIAINSTHY
jgi:hypothetical protein